MEKVLISAAMVGGSTMLGALLGFLFRSGARKHSGIILSLSAGVMLAAAVTNLIAPAVEGASIAEALLVILGLFLGASCIWGTEKLLPTSDCPASGRRPALLFALAMGIHNLPEGVAAGLGFGTGDVSDAILVTIGIALHNIPEGMISIFPLLSAGIKPRRAFLFALCGGIAEIVGTLIGHFASDIAEPVLPLTLALAGGTMLYVVAGEMIPESQEAGRRRAAFALIFGYASMLLLCRLLS